MEAWQVPIVTSSLEFLYDVGRGLLADIRARHEKQSPNEPSNIERASFLEKALETKKEVRLKQQVNELGLQQRKEEIEHLIRLSNIYSKNYHAAKEKAALWGPGLTPQILLHELENAEENLFETLNKLKTEVDAVLKDS